MKQLKILMLASSLLCLSVYAESDTYVGIGVYQTTTKDSANVRGKNYTTKYEDINFKALIGKRLNDNMAVELQYADLAKDKITTNIVTPSPITLSGSSIGIAGLYHFNPQADFSPFVKLGLHSWDYKLESIGVAQIKRNGTDAFYGVGVDGKINDTMKYRVEFERMETKDDGENTNVDNIGISLLLDF